MESAPLIPVVLFVYARPDYLRRTLECLRENNIPLLYVFSDGPKTPEVAERVKEVREILHAINWCEVHIIERSENLGLGKSILTGVTQVLQEYTSILVFEDDLICVPGTYQYLCAALEHYKDIPNVMSVTGWAHPRLTPSNVGENPYFDGRTDCLVWGTWRRAWRGMEQNSLEMIGACKKRGLNVYRYGADLVQMAEFEKDRNIWAVRFSFLHILNKGICLRPPFSLVEHIGYDEYSSNVTRKEGYKWYVPLPEKCPPIPTAWPDAVENLECPSLWQKAFGGRQGFLEKIKIFLKKLSFYGYIKSKF